MRSVGLGAAAEAAGPPPAMSILCAAWRAIRWSVVVPALQLAVYVCAAMSLMLFLERVYMAAVVSGLWLNRRRKRRRRLAAADARQRVLDEEDLEAGDDDHSCPMVLVQIPMFNERQVSKIALTSDYCSRFASSMILAAANWH